MAKTEEEPIDMSQFDWIQLKKDFSRKNETPREKLIRRVKENPVVPVGMLLTVSCLCVGLYSMKKGDRHLSQNAMRFRVGAQGFTIVALLVGVALAGGK